MSLGRSHASDLQKRPSQQFLLSPNASPTAVPPSALFPNGAESLLRLVQPQAVNLKRISSRVQLKNKRGVLQDTEERVFSEVLELIEQIDTLRAHILTAREDIRELQVSHPDVEEQVRFHGYGQRLTQQQCGDLEEENLELVRQIEQIEARQVHSLDQVLHIEKQKYDDLKAELVDSGSHSPKQLEQKVKQLKDSIVEL
jgi:predicted GNAT family acetyltransferase